MNTVDAGKEQLIIEEGNVLIVLFDGYCELTDHPEYDRWFTGVPDGYLRHATGFPIHKLKYHKKWGWLMPAIGKFNALGNSDERHRIPREYFKQRLLVDNAVCTYDINEAFKVFAEAIKWYNTQNK